MDLTWLRLSVGKHLYHLSEQGHALIPKDTEENNSKTTALHKKPGMSASVLSSHHCYSTPPRDSILHLKKKTNQPRTSDLEEVW